MCRLSNVNDIILGFVCDNKNGQFLHTQKFYWINLRYDDPFFPSLYLRFLLSSLKYLFPIHHWPVHLLHIKSLFIVGAGKTGGHFRKGHCNF